MSGHYGMPGPGGSMGKCSVCGDSFIAGVVKDLCGMDTGIESFSVGFIEQTLYCHAPKCKDTLAEAFAKGGPDNDAQAVADALPDGPLKNVIIGAIEAQEMEA